VPVPYPTSRKIFEHRKESRESVLGLDTISVCAGQFDLAMTVYTIKA